MSVESAPTTRPERQRLIGDFIATELLDGPEATIAPDEELLGGGLIDSLGVMRLIRFLEETFGVAVPPADVTIEHFSTVATIVDYVATLEPTDGPATG